MSGPEPDQCRNFEVLIDDLRAAATKSRFLQGNRGVHLAARRLAIRFRGGDKRKAPRGGFAFLSAGFILATLLGLRVIFARGPLALRAGSTDSALRPPRARRFSIFV